VAPEWGILADPRRADALGFTVESTEEVKVVKWTEARPDELPQEANEGAEGKRVSRDVSTLSGWENVPDDLRNTLKIKIAKEVGGITSANTPAAPFDPERDLPTVR
jgi:hypothetical protein